MIDHRFEGEKNLAKKLESFDFGASVDDLPEFDTIHNQSPKKSGGLWLFIKTLSLIAVLGLLAFYLLLDNREDPLYDGQQNEIVTNKDGNTRVENTQEGKRLERIANEGGVPEGKRQEGKDLRHDNPLKSTDLDKEKEIIKTASEGVEENISNSTTKRIPSLDINKGGSKEQSRIKLESQFMNMPTTRNSEEGIFSGQLEDQASSGSKEIQKDPAASSHNINRTQENSIALSTSIAFLKREGTLYDSSYFHIEPLKTLNKSSNRMISFGIQYNKGTLHAGSHETPFVSPFPTRIENGKSFGYGIFGLVHLNLRNSIRPSFTYSKNSHFHFVEGLNFSTGPTALNMELYSHELKFGLDYMISLLPQVKRFEVKVGAGLSYHKLISLESNNYYTGNEESVKNVNELDLSPLSYKLFLALEVPIYKDFVIGLEPYVIHQKRTARFTPSTFLADQGEYNLTSGLNLTLRF